MMIQGEKTLCTAWGLNQGLKGNAREDLGNMAPVWRIPRFQGPAREFRGIAMVRVPASARHMAYSLHYMRCLGVAALSGPGYALLL